MTTSPAETATATPNSTAPAPTAPEPKADVQDGLTLSEPSRRAFTAELDQLKVVKDNGPRDRTVMVLGLVLAIVGLAVTVLCYSQATGFDDLRDQLQVAILAVFGLGLVVLGSVLYAASVLTRFLRLWLLRLIYEQRDHSPR